MISLGNIYLVWRKGKGQRRIAVGLIRKNVSEGIRFSYLEKGVEKAKAEGFIPYSGFPNFDKEYNQNVIEIFSQRLMQSDRNDLGDFYDFWDIDTQFKNDPYYMLAYTQGILPTDSFEFLTDFNPVKGLQFVTEMTGLSHYITDSSLLKVGDELSYLKEPENKFDNKAVLLKKDEKVLGYVKTIHSRVFYSKNKYFSVTVKNIDKNGVLSRVFIEVKLK